MRSHAPEEAVVQPVRVRARQLLVLWQHPETRQIMPVGRLSYDGLTYAFDYTTTAASIEGFRELPGLGHLGDHFESRVLPALLRQRVMDVDRPDFQDYVASLGLGRDATPWEQIVESGGLRAGDTLQFMELPQVFAGRARARFFANGVRHIPTRARRFGDHVSHVTSGELEAQLQTLAVGDAVEVLAELDNPVDPNATLVVASGVPLGWVPRFLAGSVRSLLDQSRLFAKVIRVNGPSSPSHLRLVLEIDAPVPDRFQFDPCGEWEPISR